MKRRGWTQLEGIVQTMGCFAVNAILAAVFLPNFLRARALGQQTSCHRNLKNIATAVEMYGTDNQGRNPVTLARLCPIYLKEIPTCPAAGSDSYSSSYSIAIKPDVFSFICSGRHHTPEGDPGYHSEAGLLKGPPARRGHQTTMLDVFLSFILTVGSLWTLLVNISLCWPEPVPESKELLQSHPRLARANWWAWPLLCLLLTSLVAWTVPFSGWLGRFCVSVFVGPFLAQLLVRLGAGLWRRLGPRSASAGGPVGSPDELPRLHDPWLVEIVLGGREQLLSNWFTHGVPWLTVLLCMGLPARGPDPVLALRHSLLGLAVGIFLLFPAYRWGQQWSRQLFHQQLEWVPGSGEILLHSRRWGWPLSQSLGTQADVQSLQPIGAGLFRLRMAGWSFRIRSGPWLDHLQEHLPARES